MSGVRVPTVLLGLLLATLVIGVARADSPLAGNDVFQVLVEDTRGKDGVGVFGAVTGPENPIRAGSDILGSDGGTDAFSSYVTIRSFTTGTDYVQTNDGPASGNLVVPIERFGQVQPIDGGYETTYTLSGNPASDMLDVTVGIAATESGDGPIRVYGSVTNRGGDAVEAGVRLLLDVASDGDDGPAVISGGHRVGVEDDVPLSGNLLVSGGGADWSVDPQGEPDSVKLSHWNRAFESAFDFEPSGLDVTTAGGLDDSALLVYFGETEANARTLLPGESFDFALTLGLAAGAEICDNGEDDDGDGDVDGEDTDCTGPPTPTEDLTPSSSPTANPATVPATPTGSPTFSAPLEFPATGGPLDDAGWVALVLTGGALAAAGGTMIVRRRSG